MTERTPYHIRLHYVLPPEERDAYRSLPDEARASWKNALLEDEQIDEPESAGNYFIDLAPEEVEAANAARNVSYVLPEMEVHTHGDPGDVEVVAEAGMFNRLVESQRVDEDLGAADFTFPEAACMKFHNAAGTEKNKDAGKGYLVFLLDTGVSKAMERMTPGGVVFRKSYVGGDTEDRNGHGSMSCSLAVPNGASLAVCKVLGDNGSGSSVGITAAIRDAARFVRANPKYKGKVVLSGSLGGSPGQRFKPYEDACAEAEAAGVLCLWSAGNDGVYGVSPPANWRDDRASIAFNRPTDRRANFSNHHESAAISAEGQSILMIDKSGRLVRGSGTSFSLPVTTRHTIVGAWMRSTDVFSMLRSMLANARDSAESVRGEAHGVVNLWGAINKLPKAPGGEKPSPKPEPEKPDDGTRYIVVAGTFQSEAGANRRTEAVRRGEAVQDAYTEKRVEGRKA